MNADNLALVAVERDRVMQFVAPCMTWQPYGPDSTYNWLWLYNSNMKLSVWDAPQMPPLQLDGSGGCARGAWSTANQSAAHAVLVPSSGVPPGYHYQLHVQMMQSPQGILETAPVIVADSALLHRSVGTGWEVAFDMDRGYIIGGWGQTLQSLDVEVTDGILAGAVTLLARIPNDSQLF